MWSSKTIQVLVNIQSIPWLRKNPSINGNKNKEKYIKYEYKEIISLPACIEVGICPKYFTWLKNFNLQKQWAAQTDQDAKSNQEKFT